MPAPHEILGASASPESRKAWSKLQEDVRSSKAQTVTDDDIKYGIRAPATTQSEQRWTMMGASSRVVCENIRIIAERSGSDPESLPEGVGVEPDYLARAYLGTLGLLNSDEMATTEQALMHLPA
jgi:hypothetical protein